MRHPDTLKPVKFNQLCAIARWCLTQTPTADDSEWKSSIKARLATLEFALPDPEQLSRALSAVEAAWTKAHGPRTIPEPVSDSPPTWSPPPPLTKEEAQTLCQRIVADTRTLQTLPAESAPRLGQNRNWFPVGDIATGHSPLFTRQHAPNRTLEQIRAWRQVESPPPDRPTYRKTPKGWEPL